jgi:DNA-binding transcriptional ArsR family regulator
MPASDSSDDRPGGLLLEFFKALSDPVRIRLAGRLAAGPCDLATLASDLALPLRDCSKHLARLVDLGIVTEDSSCRPHRYSLDDAWLRERSEALLDSPRSRALAGATDDRSRVLASFFDGERLRSIPTGDARKLIILSEIARHFQSERTYSEREINGVLKEVYEYDFVTLRRLLVDFHFLNRDSGVYWVGEGRRDPSRVPLDADAGSQPGS